MQNFAFSIFVGPCKIFVEKTTSHARGSSQLFGFAANSFSKFCWSKAPPKRNWLVKNQYCRNEFADFEKIDVEHPKNIIARSANRWPNHPWHGITLQTHRSTSHIDAVWVGGISEIQLFQQRKSDLKVAKVLIVQAPLVEQSPLLMQLFFGATTLRVMSQTHGSFKRISSSNRPRWCNYSSV